MSIEIEKTPSRTTSKLFLTRAVKADSGNYTCAPKFADEASVMVHVVNGKEGVIEREQTIKIKGRNRRGEEVLGEWLKIAFVIVVINREGRKNRSRSLPRISNVVCRWKGKEEKRGAGE